MQLAAQGEAHYHIGFRPDLQGLRAIAILLVVMAHAGVPWLAGGFVGVDIFFVLSGYLITGLLIREYNSSGRIDLLAFYARRLKRLLPALTVVILATLGLANWLLSDFEAAAQAASMPFAATWTSNLWFVFSTLDYFDEFAARDLFLHTWSLGVEEQFYLFWPLILLGIFFLGRRQRVRSQDEARKYLAFALASICILSLALCLYWSMTWPTAAFYLMPARIWQFSLGALVYAATSSVSKGQAGQVGRAVGHKSASRIAFVTGLLMVFGSACWLHAELAYPGWYALMPSVGAALLIWAGHRARNRGENLLAHPALVWIGDRSYSWYLWHWPLLAIGSSLGIDGERSSVAALVLLSLLATMVTYRVIELPFWKGRLGDTSISRILLVSALAMTMMVAIAFHWKRSAPLDGGIQSEESSWRRDLPAIYMLSCDAWFHHARVEPCEFGNADGERMVVLLGDSIGMQWFSALEAAFSASDWRIVVLTKSSCAIADVEFFYRPVNGTYDVCTQWREGVVLWLENEQPDVIIIGNSPRYPFDAVEWIEGTQRILRRLSPISRHVLMIPGTPDLGFDGPGCLSRRAGRGGHSGHDECVALDRFSGVERVTGYLERAASEFPNAQILELNDLVCPGKVCSARAEDGTLVFRDSQHLSDSFVRTLIPQVKERISIRIIHD